MTAGKVETGAWLIVCIDDDSMYDIAVSVITQVSLRNCAAICSANCVMPRQIPADFRDDALKLE